MSRYENYEIKNNVFGTLSAPISSLATTIQLGDGQGARFSENMLATLENIENGKVMKREIVLITAINGDTLTVTRKYASCPANDEANTQGQVSYAFSTDDTISAYIDKEHFDEIKKSINDIYENGLDKLRTDVVSGLQISVSAGPVLVGSSYYDFEGGNLTLTDNSTNYVEIDEDGLLVSNTTSWTLENTKIAKVITSSGVITSIEDWRLGTVGGKIGGLDIHELTEKTDINADDELVIADSENIYQNKKIKAGNMLGIGEGVAVDNISKGDFVFNESIINDDSGFIAVGFTNRQKIAIKRVGNGTTFNKINVIASKYGSPTTLNVRIETDNNGKPSGTLINANAYGTISGSSVNTTATTVVVNLAGNITINEGTVCHVVFAINTVSDSAFFNIYGYDTTPNVFKIQEYNGSTWGDYTEYNVVFNVERATYYGEKANIEYQASGYFIAVSPDGTKLIYCGNGSGSHTYIRSFTMSTPYDITTATEATGAFDLGGYYVYGGGISSDGKKIIIDAGGTLILYSLSTARNAGSISQTAYKAFTSLGFPENPSSGAFCIAPDGKHIYVHSGWALYWGVLDTARDLTSCVYKGYNNTITYQDYGLQFTEDGKYLYMVQSSKKIYQYELSTPFDVSAVTLKYQATLALDRDTTGHGLCFMKNGGMLIADYKSNYSKIKQFNDSLNYGKNILGNITANGLHNIETGKADKDMIFTGFDSYIPKASIGDYTAGQKVKYNISYNNNKTGLVPGTKYYLGTDGGVTDTQNDYEVGIAIEPTILKLKQTY